VLRGCPAVEPMRPRHLSTAVVLRLPDIPPKWGNLRGGASVYIIAIAAGTLEIVSHRLVYAGALARMSDLCERQGPTKARPTSASSGNDSRLL